MILLSDRIQQLLEHSGLSLSEFSRAAGFKTPQAVRELIKGRTKTLSYEARTRLLNRFPEVSSQWLDSGVGEMILPNNKDVEIDLKMGPHSQMALHDINNIGDANTKIIILTARINNLEEQLRSKTQEIAAQNARITDLNLALDRERKLSDYLMKKERGL